MNANLAKLSAVAVLAVVAALVVIAVAAAQSGGDNTEGDTPSPTLTATPVATPGIPEPTDSPEPTDTPKPSPSPEPVPSSDVTPSPEPGDDDAVEDTESDEVRGPLEGTTSSLNPAGHCVELPNNSDIVLDPAQHPNWAVGSCDGGDSAGDDDGDTPGEGNGPPSGRTPSLNPEGVCVALPNNSDIVQNPGNHPGWTVGGCDLPAD
jgi:hypothetical protein